MSAALLCKKEGADNGVIKKHRGFRVMFFAKKSEEDTVKMIKETVIFFAGRSMQ